MDPSRSVARDGFEWSLAAALRGSDVPHFIAVHAVDGLEPGLYRWPDARRPAARRQPARGAVPRLPRPGAPRDASFVVVAAVDIDELDDRGYREAQLDAGLVSGRLQLAAFALGVGAPGMTFLDSEIPALLGEPLAGAALHLRRRADLSPPTRRPAGRADHDAAAQATQVLTHQQPAHGPSSHPERGRRRVPLAEPMLRTATRQAVEDSTATRELTPRDARFRLEESRRPQSARPDA